MSRVRLLNVPHNATEKSLRDHVVKTMQTALAAKKATENLDITDCKIVRTERGTVRMAFMGFRNASSGASAVKLLDGSFIGSQKIAVEQALGLKDAKSAQENDFRKREAAKKRRPQENEPESTKAQKTESKASAQEERPSVEAALEHQRGLESVSDADFLSKLLGEPEKVAASGGSGTNTRSNRVRVTNIPFTATESDIKNFFSSKCGPVKAVHIPLTKDTKQSKGSAYVEFDQEEQASAAVDATDGVILMGRLIRVEYASPDPYANKKRVEGDDEKGLEHSSQNPTYKQKLRDKRKESDAQGDAPHSALFVSSAAAVDTVASRLGTSAQAMVSVEAANAPVKAAVAEAVLTSEAKRVLGEEGVDMEILKKGNALHAGRSDTTILVKGIAAGVPLSELVALFRRAGELETVASVANSTFLIVSFLRSQDAQKAFQRLAYKQVRGSPLYLEWAPLGILKDEKPNDDTQVKSDCLTLYITNLPFGLDEGAFAEYLRDVAPRYAQQPNVISKIHVVSDKGRAYVTVSDPVFLTYLKARLKGRSYEGRTIAVEEAKPLSTTVPGSKLPAATVPKGKDPLKLIVKNLPFEAGEKDLRQLFASFTEIKSVRVPRRLHNVSQHHENNHRGFGFVEFLTEAEAEHALATLSNTHLYGRHLVLEYAAQSTVVGEQ